LVIHLTCPIPGEAQGVAPLRAASNRKVGHPDGVPFFSVLVALAKRP
jgi:hypothetical protein